MQATVSEANSATMNGLMQLVAGVMAFIVAVLPKPDWQHKASSSSTADVIPNHYDPAALERYYSTRPFECIQRSIKVSMARLQQPAYEAAPPTHLLRPSLPTHAPAYTWLRGAGGLVGCARRCRLGELCWRAAPF